MGAAASAEEVVADDGGLDAERVETGQVVSDVGLEAVVLVGRADEGEDYEV